MHLTRIALLLALTITAGATALLSGGSSATGAGVATPALPSPAILGTPADERDRLPAWFMQRVGTHLKLDAAASRLVVTDGADELFVAPAPGRLCIVALRYREGGGSCGNAQDFAAGELLVSGYKAQPRRYLVAGLVPPDVSKVTLETSDGTVGVAKRVRDGYVLYSQKRPARLHLTIVDGSRRTVAVPTSP